MKKILTTILAFMALALPSLAQESNSKSESPPFHSNVV